MNLDFSKVGKKDPCPCGSGKKFKRCHGASLEAETSAAAAAPDAGSANSAFDPSNFDMNSLDPAWMMSFANALQRLPKGQVQRLQSIMQKAMVGKDVTREAEDLERSLPAEFKSLIDSFKPPETSAAQASSPTETPSSASETPEAAEAKNKFSKVWNRLFRR